MRPAYVKCDFTDLENALSKLYTNQSYSTLNDIKKELNSLKINIEQEAYQKELTEGKYRDTKRLIKSLKQRNINVKQF